MLNYCSENEKIRDFKSVKAIKQFHSRMCLAIVYNSASITPGFITHCGRCNVCSTRRYGLTNRLEP